MSCKPLMEHTSPGSTHAGRATHSAAPSALAAHTRRRAMSPLRRRPRRRGSDRIETARFTRVLTDLRNDLLAEWSQGRAELQAGGMESESDGMTVRASTVVLTNTLEHVSRRLREVDLAMERLQVGEYGTCADCEGAIPVSRLRANPTATRCTECQHRIERGRR